MHTVLESIATANPPNQRSQSELATYMAQVEGIPLPIRDRISTLYRRSGIDSRQSCLVDYGAELQDFEFYPHNWAMTPIPTTRDRIQAYKTHAPQLGKEAASQALAQSQTLPEQITHLIVVSCTGFSAPGLDIQLVQSLGLPSTTARSMIGFMGCNAAFNGLKIAHAFCQADHKAKVLLVCVELCSLHFQVADSLEQVIVNAIFADGAAAVVLSSRAEPTGKLTYLDSAAMIAPDSLDAMTWDIGDTGFLMQLSAQVPSLIEQNLPNYLVSLLHRHNLTQESLDFWAVHPGGRQILDKIYLGLNLPKDRLQASYDVLRRHGNMSSPTILFILKQIMDDPTLVPTDHPRIGLALGFGPGLSIEGALFHQYARKNSG